MRAEGATLEVSRKIDEPLSAIYEFPAKNVQSLARHQPVIAQP
jgi:hypothetical protein